jgi:hypothetical protein
VASSELANPSALGLDGAHTRKAILALPLKVKLMLGVFIGYYFIIVVENIADIVCFFFSL